MKYTDFYLYLTESRDSDGFDYNAAEDFHDRRDVQLHNIIDSFIEGNGKVRILWKTVPASLITSVWFQFGKYNKIDINKLDKIADQILTNIARLQAATDIAGHGTYSVEDELKDEGYNLSEKQWDDLSWYVEDYISDYGLKPLKNKYVDIFNAKSPEEQLYAIDKALNIIHQRNDLAAMFIEGGTKTLLKIASQGGYSSDSN
jgi:hypothetical protein